MTVLKTIPLASVLFVSGVVLLTIAYVSNDVSFDKVWEDLLFLGGACGAIGYVRNQAGHGVSR